MNINKVRTLVPVHEVEDDAKVKKIAASLMQDGWVGVPLVVWGDQLITGSHRYAAIKLVAEDLWNLEVPTVDFEDLFEDWDEVWESAGEPTIDELWYSGLLEELPAEVIEQYGIQW